jgi:HPt (histidine-containing phosphotransfer) domain-containing protein
LSAIDKDTLAQLVEDISLADVRRIVAAFRDDIGRLVPLAEQAAAARDPAKWRRALHSIAGASGALGCTGLEQAARRGMGLADADADAMRPDTAALKLLARQTMDELDACLDSLVETP